ncbi:MAG: hypothetical protein JWN37_365 [Candidatus Nomurabacteria bacterium]|nr:hypothetical protein [Candidatus Nomurabacteria bacterium]
MKVITLVPVKNEEWILPYSLKNFSSFSDVIIMADQRSTDNTVAICKTFDKVRVIENPYKEHTNEIRWLLLDEARKYEGDKIIICLDADELISPDAIIEMKRWAADTNSPIGFSSRWIQAYGSIKTYREDGVWKDNYKPFAFLDSPSLDYNRVTVTNDHAPRIPYIENMHVLSSPIIHLQYLARLRSELKQAFYMCKELLEGRSPRAINYRYSAAKFSNKIPIKSIDEKWLAGIQIPGNDIFASYDPNKLSDIRHLFDQKGILYFENLDIWDIELLKKDFVEKTGRLPYPKKYPLFLVKANNIKNKIKSAIMH